MVRRAYEVCVKDLLAAWSGAPTRGLDGDEHGINVRQHIRVVHRQNPPARRFVVHGEEAYIAGLPWVSLAVSPRLESTEVVILAGLPGQRMRYPELPCPQVNAYVGALRVAVT